MVPHQMYTLTPLSLRKSKQTHGSQKDSSKPVLPAGHQGGLLRPHVYSWSLANEPYPSQQRHLPACLQQRGRLVQAPASLPSQPFVVSAGVLAPRHRRSDRHHSTPSTPTSASDVAKPMPRCHGQGQSGSLLQVCALMYTLKPLWTHQGQELSGGGEGTLMSFTWL
jgi:hypothetical protein